MVWAPRWAMVCLVCACVLVSARPVRADEGEPRQVVTEGGYKKPYRVESQTKRGAKIWYGYQTLAADAVAVGMMLAALQRDNGILMGLGIGTYVLGAPLVHLAHGGGATLPSFLMRLAPPAMFAVGAAACVGVAAVSGVEDGDESEQIDPGLTAVLGVTCGLALVGALAFPAVIIIDAAGLAYERVEQPRVTRPTAQSLVVPYYDPTRRVGMVSWAGTF